MIEVESDVLAGPFTEANVRRLTNVVPTIRGAFWSAVGR